RHGLAKGLRPARPFRLHLAVLERQRALGHLLVDQAVMAVVFWTGIIKWQLPRIKKWNRKRQKAKAATEA
ncbi:MAG: hypothetical protein ISP84_04175, partial [Candidatus Poseidonia sp.]|nr:hypothetical protein [Poseidonia sp.]